MLILKPSGIHGVGVFTVRKIRRGEKVSLWRPRDYKFRSTVSIVERRFCIPDKNGWHGPANFLAMSIGWYLNHSSKPNLKIRRWVALRDIARGEELTIDYSKL